MLRGNLAPDGAVIKPTAAEPQLLKHTGRAVVFDDYNDMAARIDDDDLDVDADSVLVLQNAGPLGGPGMPEWGMLPIPKKLLKQGVRDMVRISDARMSGTSYGACVLHVAPESFVGGPLALVQDGDLIELDVPARKLNLKVSDEELAQRSAAWKPPAPQVRARLRRALLAARHAGRRGLRLRFPRRHGADRRTGDPLMDLPQNAFKRAAQGREAADRPVVEPVVEPHRRGRRRRRLRLAAARQRALAGRHREPAHASCRRRRPTRTHPVVRMPWNDMVTIKRVLDIGAQSLLMPVRADAGRGARPRWPRRAIRRRACAASPAPRAPRASAA